MGLADIVVTAAGYLTRAVSGFGQSILVETLARARIDRARSMIMHGEAIAAHDLITSSLGPLTERTAVEQRAEGGPSPGMVLLTGIAASVAGQALEHQGLDADARLRYREAVEILGGVDVSALSGPDRSDYGLALAALGADEQARAQLELARDEEGLTPAGAVCLARLLLRRGELTPAEHIVRNRCRVAPSDPDVLELLGRIEAERRHPGQHEPSSRRPLSTSRPTGRTMPSSR